MFEATISVKDQNALDEFFIYTQTGPFEKREYTEDSGELIVKTSQAFCGEPSKSVLEKLFACGTIFYCHSDEIFQNQVEDPQNSNQGSAKKSDKKRKSNKLATEPKVKKATDSAGELKESTKANKAVDSKKDGSESDKTKKKATNNEEVVNELKTIIAQSQNIRECANNIVKFLNLPDRKGTAAKHLEDLIENNTSDGSKTWAQLQANSKLFAEYDKQRLTKYCRSKSLNPLKMIEMLLDKFSSVSTEEKHLFPLTDVTEANRAKIKRFEDWLELVKTSDAKVAALIDAIEKALNLYVRENMSPAAFDYASQMLKNDAKLDPERFSDGARAEWTKIAHNIVKFYGAGEITSAEFFMKICEFIKN